MEEPSAPVHARSMVTVSPRSCPDSSATRAVISLVVLAISRRVWPSFSYSTRPVPASIRTALAAETLGTAFSARTTGRPHNSSAPARTAKKNRFNICHLLLSVDGNSMRRLFTFVSREFFTRRNPPRLPLSPAFPASSPAAFR